MKRLYFLFLSVALLSIAMETFGEAAGSPVLTPHRFMAAVREDDLVRCQEKLARSLSPHPGENGYLEKMEFRASVDGTLDESDMEEQTCTIRLYPRTPHEAECSRTLTKAVAEFADMDRDEILGTALRKRYQLVLDYCRAVSLLDHHRSLRAVLQDRETVLCRKAVSGLTQDVPALLTARTRLMDAHLDVAALETRLAGLRKEILAIADPQGEIRFETEDLIPVTGVRTAITDLPLSPDGNNDLQRFRQKASMAEGAYRLELAEQHNYFEFIEISHSFREDEKSRTALEVGLTLPFTGADSGVLWRRQAEALREKGRYDAELAAWRDKRKTMMLELEEMLSRYECRAQDVARLGGDEMAVLEKRLSQPGSDPLDLLKFKESVIVNQMEKTELGFDIRSRYIDLLYEQGRLTRPPLVDYLTNHPEPL